MKGQDSTNSYTLPYTVRASPAPFGIFSIFGGLITVLLLPTFLQNPSTLILLLLIWVPIAALLLWISSHTITLKSDRLRYSTLFSRREMLFSDITRVQVTMTQGRGAGYLLQVYDHASSEPLTISLKPFSKKGITIAVTSIATHSPSATFDQRTQDIRKGTFR